MQNSKSELTEHVKCYPIMSHTCSMGNRSFYHPRHGNCLTICRAYWVPHYHGGKTYCLPVEQMAEK